MTELATLIGYAVMLVWAVVMVVLMLGWIGQEIRRQRAYRRIHKSIQRVARESRPTFTDKDIDFAISGPTPEEYWGKDRRAA